MQRLLLLLLRQFYLLPLPLGLRRYGGRSAADFEKLTESSVFMNRY